MERLWSFCGIFALIGLAWVISFDRKRLDLKVIATGLLIQFVLGVLILWTDVGRAFFDGAQIFFQKVLGFSNEGSRMVFGEKFEEHYFAFAVLPAIIFISSIMSVLFYIGFMQPIVKAMAWIMVRVMNVSGSESLAASANIFLGQNEAPLVIQPYLKSMTRSELMALMVGGFANASGSTLAAYVAFGADAGHLLSASLMSAPASLLLAKIILPERQESVTKGVVKIEVKTEDENFLDAACRGAGEGLKIALTVAAMLIAFVAFASLINWTLSFLPHLSGTPLTMERILSWFFAPLAFLMGVPWDDVSNVGMLLGKKIFLNEFLAYIDLGQMKAQMSDRAFVLSTYALCGFANFSSIAIQIGGIGVLVPERRKDLAQIAFRAMLGGTLATMMTACVAGVLL